MSAGGSADRNPAAAASAAAGGSRRRRGGAVWVIVVLLAGSGVLRLASGAQALAEVAGTSHAAVPNAGHAGAEVCEPDPDVAPLMQAIRDRNAEQDAREGRLADREQAMALISAQLDARLAELVAAEERLAATLAQADTAAEGDVARLAAMYEAMKPKEAAPLFEEMAPDFAAGFLSRMRPEAAGAVLAALDPKTAYTISVILAGRNARAPQDRPARADSGTAPAESLP
ncbi:MotE family protein [Frigidibacter oleivorans]|uniref:MotE family protein n=1 Tax=Frigidibacter oleivorans TaxID=2487129 RepID=UPI000F8C5E72|nr:hypothetical protein [Frigidibacter oleivorans]